MDQQGPLHRQKYLANGSPSIYRNFTAVCEKHAWHLPINMKTQVLPTKVIVIGTSSGGLDALKKLIHQLDRDLPCSILVVKHLSPEVNAELIVHALNEFDTVKCHVAVNGSRLEAGNLYLAPSDHHLMIDPDQRILITKGATENRSRPSIDPLFRSAAIAFGNGVIAIVLTGYLDDGTAGMRVVKQCGGICIVQDPEDAEYPDMPRNALHNVTVDHSVPLDGMGALLKKIVRAEPNEARPTPEEVIIEARIAARVLSDLRSVEALGDQVPFNCPGCGGVLWQIDKDPALRFRCHTGHAYTSSTLLAEQNRKIEETMWIALRMFEERKNLLTTIAQQNQGIGSVSAQERADASQVHIDRIRMMLRTDEPTDQVS